MVEDRKKVTLGMVYPAIAHVVNFKSATKAARDFLASETACEGLSATAVIITSAVGSTICNFYIRISKPLRPCKLFTDQIEAKKWLAQFVKREF